MSDEVDDQLRRAMATLDHQAPSDFFDTLADRTLARLDGPALAELPAGSASELAGDDPGLKIMRTADAAAPRDAPATDAAGAAPAPRPRARRARLVAAIAVGLAAAAGAVLFVSVRDKDASAPMAMRAEELQAESRAVAQDRVTSIRRLQTVPSAAPSKSGDSAPASAGDPVEQAERARGGYGGPQATAGSGVMTKGAQNPVGKPTGKAPGKLVGKASGAGAGSATADTEPVSSADLKRALDNKVTAQVRACLDGKPGSATVRLSVAPTGRIQGVAVTGPLAGTPAAACVERVVRTIRLPPWEGPPESRDYVFRIAG